MVYAHLQLAQDAKARALIDEIDKAGRDGLLLKENLPNLGSYTGLAVIPARYSLERGDWKAAAVLPVGSDQAPHGRFFYPLHARSRHGSQR